MGGLVGCAEDAFALRIFAFETYSVVYLLASVRRATPMTPTFSLATPTHTLFATH